MTLPLSLSPYVRVCVLNGRSEFSQVELCVVFLAGCCCLPAMSDSQVNSFRPYNVQATQQ